MLCILAQNGNSRTAGRSSKRAATAEADAVVVKRGLFVDCEVQQLDVSSAMSVYEIRCA